MAAEGSVILSVSQSLISAASGLVGVCLGGYITARNQSKERKRFYLDSQLKEFYGPLLSSLEQTRAKERLRDATTESSIKNREQTLKQAADQPDYAKLRDQSFLEDKVMIDYNRNLYKNELLPLWQKMLDQFKEHMYLAERPTLKHYGSLVDHIETCYRRSNGSITITADLELPNANTFNETFYHDLKQDYDRLVRERSKL
jgi:hypothetical protein